MTNIVPSQAVEYSNQRILTTEQVASAYGTISSHIITTFNRNKERYTAGKHYFLLEGDDLKTFKSYLTNCNVAVDKFAPSLLLWTEKGAWLLAKSLNTDEAWQACELLVDEYYRSQVQIAALQEKIELLQTALVQALEVPHVAPEALIDYELMGEFETALDALQTQIKQLADGKKRDVTLEHITKKLNKIGAMLNQQEQMLTDLDQQFIQQAGTLTLIQPAQKLLN